MASKRSGTIDLEVSRVIKTVSPLDGVFSVQMLSNDISASTDFTLEVSCDGINWDTAKEFGSDISDTLVINETMVKSFEVDAGLYFRINFGGVTTGNVDYIVNS